MAADVTANFDLIGAFRAIDTATNGVLGDIKQAGAYLARARCPVKSGLMQSRIRVVPDGVICDVPYAQIVDSRRPFFERSVREGAGQALGGAAMRNQL